MNNFSLRVNCGALFFLYFGMMVLHTRKGKTCFPAGISFQRITESAQVSLLISHGYWNLASIILSLSPHANVSF
jgi:hypothetical protein